MASNQYVNKVIFGNNTILDISSDTVVASALLSGYTAHSGSGASISGSIVTKSSSDLTSSGATVTVPAGYYSSAATKTVTDSNLIAANIKNGVSIFGVTGTYAGNTVLISESQDINGGDIYTIITTEDPIYLDTLNVTSNGSYVPTAGHYYSSVNVNVAGGSGSISLQEKTGITPTESSQTIYPDTGYGGFSSVQINAISSTYVGSGITTRTSSDLTNSGLTVTVPAGYYSTAASKTLSDANLAAGNIKNGVTIFGVTGSYSGSGATGNLQEKTNITPTESSQIIEPDSGYTGLSSVQINAISSTYVGSGITSRSSSDLSASGATVTVPAGYYSTQATKSVSSLTLPTSTSSSATSGYTSKATISRSTSDQYINIGTGYNSAGGYYKVEAVANGSATAPASISSSSASISTSTNTITLTKTVSVTPSVTAGYISSGTVGDSSVSLTASVSVNPNVTVSGKTVTIPAGYYTSEVSQTVMAMSLPTSTSSSATSGYTLQATVTGGTTDQYINIGAGYNDAGGCYKISGDSNLVASNIKDGVSIFGVTGSYSGTSPSLQAKTNINPTTSSQTIEPDNGYDGLSSVQINAMPSLTLPTSVSASATSGYTSKATISRSTSDQYINIGTGYNSTGGYYKISAVANGSATGPSSLSGSSATVSTGTNTITLTKTGVNTTPTVSAGYVSAATSSSATVTLTASVTTKAAATITPGTSDQTIASGTYLTGTQTISGDADLIAANIKTGVDIFGVTGTYTSDATATASDINSGKTAYINGSKITGEQTFITIHTGTSTPSSSLGSNGDIYIKTL